MSTPKQTHQPVSNPMVSSAPRMSTADIAALLGLSREHVTDRITKRPDFPKPFIKVSQRTRYWRTSDILEWIRKGAQ